jgi:hypothetical protein
MCLCRHTTPTGRYPNESLVELLALNFCENGLLTFDACFQIMYWLQAFLFYDLLYLLQC